MELPAGRSYSLLVPPIATLFASHLRDKTPSWQWSLAGSSLALDWLLLSYYITLLINPNCCSQLDDGSGVFLNTIIYCLIDVLLITLLSTRGCLIMWKGSAKAAAESWSYRGPVPEFLTMCHKTALKHMHTQRTNPIPKFNELGNRAGLGSCLTTLWSDISHSTSTEMAVL